MNGEKLTKWLMNHIRENYRDDVALVIHCNSLRAPGEEKYSFPEFFIPATEKGKELACSFIIDGIKHDFYERSWEYLEGFENATDYDTMIFADSMVMYARCDEDMAKYEQCKRKLFVNLANNEHMKQVAIKDYQWAVTVYRDSCLESSLSHMMMDGSYVCDLLVHSLASLNNRYIPQSFTNQYEFLLSLKNIPENFADLYLKINQSKDIWEIRRLCAEIIHIMEDFLGVHNETASAIDADGLAGWYEEMIGDWARIRGFAHKNEIRNVRGWATKLQYSLDTASDRYGITRYGLLSKFNENDLTTFLQYAGEIEDEIRNILTHNHAKLNEFASVDEFITAVEKNEIRKP